MVGPSAWWCFMPHITHTCMAFLTHSTVAVFFFHPEPRLEYLTYLRKFYPSSKFAKYNRPTRTIKKKESRLRVWNMTYRIMHESQWITIFGSRVRWFANDFHELRNHGKECIILFLTRYFISWAYTIQNNSRSLISPLLLRTVFRLALRHHNNCSVTWCEGEVLTLWRHIRRLFLHVQLDTNVIFTNEWQPRISISQHPVIRV